MINSAICDFENESEAKFCLKCESRLTQDPSTISESWEILREREIITREIAVIYCKYCGEKNQTRRTSCRRCTGNLR